MYCWKIKKNWTLSYECPPNFWRYAISKRERRNRHLATKLLLRIDNATDIRSCRYLFYNIQKEIKLLQVFPLC